MNLEIDKQAPKASSPIDLTVEGKVTSPSNLQTLKTLFEIVSKPSLSVTLVKASQAAKELVPKVFKVLGRVTSFKAKQYEKACVPSVSTHSAKLRLVKLSQLEKAP